MTKDEALTMEHTTFMQINERFPRRDNGDGYFDKEIIACKEALEFPPKAKTQQPTKEEILGKVFDAVYAQYPKKRWQELSDDEIDAIDFPESGTATIRDFTRAIEAKLKEKNHE